MTNSVKTFGDIDVNDVMYGMCNNNIYMLKVHKIASFGSNGKKFYYTTMNNEIGTEYFVGNDFIQTMVANESPTFERVFSDFNALKAHCDLIINHLNFQLKDYENLIKENK